LLFLLLHLLLLFFVVVEKIGFAVRSTAKRKKKRRQKSKKSSDATGREKRQLIFICAHFMCRQKICIINNYLTLRLLRSVFKAFIISSSV
jgi:hypothetical protein